MSDFVASQPPKASVTRHAQIRAHARLGLGKRAITRRATIALRNGLTHAEARGRLKRFFDSQYLVHRNANNIRLHGNACFIFNAHTLLTVFPLPHKLAKLMPSR